MAETHEVNIELGDDMSRMMYQASKMTFNNIPELVREEHESFSGYRAMTGKYIGKHILDLEFNLGFDGIGTKVEVSERLNDHSTAAYDLFAMVLDDASVRGAQVLALGSIIDVRELSADSDTITSGMRGLATGMVGAAATGQVVVINGEIAELGYRINGYGDFNYNWGAGVLWFAHKDRVLTGHQIKEGDALVGLAEPGLRSNGITDVRTAMKEYYGDDWHTQVESSLSKLTLGKLVQTPSTIYHGLMTDLTGGFDIDREPKAHVSAFIHVTGGGQPSKIGRVLEPSGLGVVIDNPITPPAIMRHTQKLRGFSDRKAYGKWHMGPGGIIATREPNKVIAEANARGIGAQEIGYVTDKPGIKILNKGAQQDEEWLEYPFAA